LRLLYAKILLDFLQKGKDMLKFLLIFLPLLLFASTQKISVQLEWKHQFEFAGFYAAIEQGYYKDAGFEVELKEFKDGIDISDEIIDHKSTFGISSSSLILDKLRNKPVVLIASYFKQNALALVTSKDIKTISDLKNKKIMAMPYEIKHTSLGVILKDANLNKDDFTLISHDFKIDKFKNGEVDAMSVYITSQLYLLDKANIDYNILNPSDYGIYSYDLELFTSQDVALSSPQMVKRFVTATNRGWEYAFKHKEEIIDLIYNKYTKRKSKEALMYEAIKTQKLFKTDIFTIGSVVPELIKLNMIIYEKLGLVDEKVNLKKIFNSYMFETIKSSNELGFNEEELLFLNQNKIITIANEMDWPPFDYNEFGKAKGLSIDYIKLLFDKAGLKYRFINGYSWTELLTLFKEKKIDILPAFYKNEEREKYTNFMPSYYMGKLAIFSLADNKSIKSKDDLSNKKIGVQKDDGGVPMVKEYLKDSQVIEIATNDELVRLLSLKKIDAVVGNPMLFNYCFKKSNLSNIHFIEYIKMNHQEQKQISLHIGVQKELKVLYGILKKVVNSLNETEIMNLKKQWLIDGDKNHILLSEKEKNYLNTKEIKMCIDPDWMPFEKLENGQHIGMSADYFKIINKNLDTTITVVPTLSWSQSIEFAKKRECDIFSLAMKTPKREKYMNFTTPYLEIPLVLATKADIPFVTNFKSIQNRSIGIPKGYAFIELLKNKHPNLNIIEVKNISDGLAKVKKGELFGYIGTLASVGYMFQTKYTGELKIVGQFNENWKLGIAVRNDDPMLLNILQKAIKSIKEDQKQDILNKWISIKYEKGVDYTLAWQILFIAVFVLVLILFWIRKLALLNQQLKIARTKADEATKIKANFLANMSHEIRTPMNSIVGMSYLIKETKLNKIQYGYIQQIENSSKNLLNLINQILDFSKLEAKKLEIHEINFNLIEILNDIENMLMLKVNEKGLEFNIIYDKSTSVHLYGDSLRLSQILINLTSNAVKFTDKGKVQLIVEKLNNDIFRFSVVDTGIGLNNEQLENIFLSFSQADSSITRKYGGTGLGLSISKELVQLLGGKIFVESTFGKGSKFSFEIKLQLSKQKVASTKDTYKEISNINDIKKSISQERVKELFQKLKEATTKRRPQLCEPILKEFEKYNLNKTDQELFKSVKTLIKKYKFNEARELL